MFISKNSKLIVCSVLFGCLLVGCNESTATQLSLTNLERNSLYTPSINSHTSLWADMSRHYALKDTANRNAEQRAQVQKQIQILQKNPKALYNKLKEAEPYISYIYTQTQKRNLPAELALLPVVESGFDPHAKSHAGATGLWQIMPKTGQGLGLVASKDYDGRKDVVASTDAALSYLASLKKTFQEDWFLALAAYNWGPGNLQKSIKKGKWYKRTDYWQVKMPTETQQYVPKLLALAEIVKNPAKYNIELPAMTTKPVLAEIHVKDGVDLKQVAKTSGIDVDTMKKLNPGYIKLATAKNAPNTLLVPASKEKLVIQAIKDPEGAKITLAANTTDKSENSAHLTLATNDTTADTNDEASSDNANLIKAILKQGKWVVVALADVPASQGSV
jgi:membrane-bound lytic murein transglycosylase D